MLEQRAIFIDKLKYISDRVERASISLKRPYLNLGYLNIYYQFLSENLLVRKLRLLWKKLLESQFSRSRLNIIKSKQFIYILLALFGNDILQVFFIEKMV